MADENKPAFYPRVGNIKAKNFRSAQPAPFIDDPRAMDLPQFGDVDLSQPTKANLEMGRRMAERDAQLRRQQEADRSPLEKVAGALEAVRFMGSALTQSINSFPTRMVHGDEAAEKFMQDRIYKPTQPVAYEYAQDVGDFLEKLETEYKLPPVATGEVLGFAPLIQAGMVDAARKGTGAAVRGGMALERGIEPVVRGALERGGLPREMALGMGANTQSNVIKPKGGNWFGDTVNDALKNLKRDTMMGAPNDTVEDVLKKKEALNNWVDRNLTNYVKKEMATPEDPVRKLAEEGVVHFPVAEDPRYWARKGESAREDLGGTKMAQSDLAKQWENRTDAAINRETAQMNQDMMHLAPGMYSDKDEWIKKLPPDTPLYSGNRLMNPADLGFDHILDVLRQDVAEGRIRPEQLNKVSMEQAVRRTYEYDQEMARKMRETALKQQEGFPVHKEYPEGYKWLELALPKNMKLPEGYSVKPDPITNRKTGTVDTNSYRLVDPEGKLVGWGKTEEEAISSGLGEKVLEDALKYEGNTMGHCVGGYCPDVLEGRSRIFSLRDAKGEPHVTVEVQPSKYAIRWDVVKEYMPAAEQEAKNLPNGYTDNDVSDIAMRMAKENEPQHIIQIKGKQNAAPKADYLPYVQDFVKSGNWGQVGDLKNTGLRHSDDAIGAEAMQALKEQGVEIPKYITQAEAIKLSSDAMSKAGKYLPPDLEGMKRGGVAISHNPDTMMLELNEQKMKNGVPAYGAGKAVVKKGLQAAKPPKVQPPIKFPVTRGPSIPEIRAMAERMAPQVMGEFVRAAPTPSAPKPSTSVVGKTQKQFEREKTLPIEYENIKPEVTPEEFDYAKKKGALLIGAAGDVTPANRMLLSIDQQPLSVPVHMQAGPEWELYNPTAWAASDQMAKTYMKRAGQAAEAYDADPYLHYHKMTPDANYYAMHHFNSLLSHLRPEELKLRDPKLYQQMVEEIRTKDVGYGKHPDFEGFEDPLNLQIHAQIDPNFRRHIGALFNGPKFTQRYGLNSGQDVLAATSLPELRDLEAGASGYAVVPLDVKAPLRNFEAESQTYDTGFPKAGPSGRSKYPSPYQLIYRDTLNWMKENPSENKSSEFGRMNMIVPKQQIDDELIDAIGEYQRRMKELTGKKKGGSVKKPIKKAAGGDITGDDLIIEERPL